jgi:hypothetical protein
VRMRWWWWRTDKTCRSFSNKVSCMPLNDDRVDGTEGMREHERWHEGHLRSLNVHLKHQRCTSDAPVTVRERGEGEGEGEGVGEGEGEGEGEG